MVPRSYQHQRAPSPVRRSPSPRPRAGPRTSPRPSRESTPPPQPPGKPRRLLSAPAATPSKPVVIPTRTQPPPPATRSRRGPPAWASISEKDAALDAPAPAPGPTSTRASDPAHDPTARPSSVAALLAVTTIPKPRALAIRYGRARRAPRPDALAGTPDSDPAPRPGAPSSSSPRSWSILHAPPDDADDPTTDTERGADEGEEEEDDDEGAASSSLASTLPSVGPLRSLSSCDSIPELDADTDPERGASPAAAASSPRTPADHRPPPPARKRRAAKPHSPPAVRVPDSAAHPLAPHEPPSPTSRCGSTSPPPAARSPLPLAPHARRPSTTTAPGPPASNLTTSLRRLRAAARSLAAAATPKLYTPDLVLARPSSSSSASPHLALPPPTRPAPRLPPTATAHAALAPLRARNVDALPFHLAAPYAPFRDDDGEARVSGSVQLAARAPLAPAAAGAPRGEREVRDGATAPPVFLPVPVPVGAAGVAAGAEAPGSGSGTTGASGVGVGGGGGGGASGRGREPRENRDFLRVVVLEMNMRRAGKLEGEGRARIWVGPRAGGEAREGAGREEGGGDGKSGVGEGSVDGARAVPRRWVARVPA